MTDWLVQIMHSMGYVGIFLLLVLARVVPPVPAETVIPLAGIGAATGEYHLLGIAVAGGLGSLAGQLVWYLPSRLWTPEKLKRFLKCYGHWLTIRPKQVERATRWFQKRGGIAVLLVQPLPGLRTLISIPAGACRMPVWRYSLASATGSILWTLLLAWSGYMMSTWPGIHALVGYVTVGLVVVLVGVYLFRLFLHFRAARAEASRMPTECGPSGAR
ncbi:MAG TPA: DedA family protein [Azospirillum sp.]|nr:DedA family protein [Azospirillum sp.]